MQTLFYQANNWWFPVFRADLSDEFIDPNVSNGKWLTHNGYSGRPPGYVDPSMVRIGDGVAQLTVTEDASAGTYRTPLLESIGTLTYGYVEVRAKIDPTHLNQAFWLYRWTPEQAEEIDVFEIAPGVPGREDGGVLNYHVIDNVTGEHIAAPVEVFAPGFDPTQYHTYALDWTPETLRWYVNGLLIREEPNLYFHDPLQLILSSEVHASWLGLPTEDELPSTMEVDYVRVWEYQSGWGLWEGGA